MRKLSEPYPLVKEFVVFHGPIIPQAVPVSDITFKSVLMSRFVSESVTVATFLASFSAILMLWLEIWTNCERKIMATRQEALRGNYRVLDRSCFIVFFYRKTSSIFTCTCHLWSCIFFRRRIFFFFQLG